MRSKILLFMSLILANWAVADEICIYAECDMVVGSYCTSYLGEEYHLNSRDTFQINGTTVDVTEIIVPNPGDSYAVDATYTACIDASEVLIPGQNNQFAYNHYFYVLPTVYDFEVTIQNVYVERDGRHLFDLCDRSMTRTLGEDFTPITVDDQTTQEQLDGTRFSCQYDYYVEPEIDPEIVEQLEEAREYLQGLESRIDESEGPVYEEFTVVNGVFDEIYSKDFSSILESDLRPEGYEEQLLSALELYRNLRFSVNEVESEAARLESRFESRLEQIDNHIQEGLSELGITGNDFNTGHTLLIPAVNIPLLVSGDNFTVEDSYYRNYAEGVLYQLELNLASGNNEVFLLTVDAWTTTNRHMRDNLSAQSFQSPNEWNEYNDAFARVEAYLFGDGNSQGMLDRDLWFADSPVAQSQREAVEVIKEYYPVEGALIEQKMRTYRGREVSEEVYNILKTIDVLGRGIKSAIQTGEFADEEFRSLVSGAVIALSETACEYGPLLLGDFNDLYELVIGKTMCTSEELSVTDRMFSGLGLVAGTGAFWRGVGEVAGLTSKSKRVIKLTAATRTKFESIGIYDTESMKLVMERWVASGRKVKDFLKNPKLTSRINNVPCNL